MYLFFFFPQSIVTGNLNHPIVRQNVYTYEEELLIFYEIESVM